MEVATKRSLEPIYEAVFDDCSKFLRRRIGDERAIRLIIRMLNRVRLRNS